MDDRTVHVYGLYEGFSNRPFYIGVTVDPKKRLWSHRAAANGKRVDSLTGCGVKGEDITMRLLAQCDDRSNAETIEKALQSFFDVIVITQGRLVPKRSNGTNV